MEQVGYEIVGADLPPEPPVRTIVMDAKNNVYQRIRWRHYYDGFICQPTIEWTGVGERKREHRPTWTELLDRGPVTILWRAPEPVDDTEED